MTFTIIAERRDLTIYNRVDAPWEANEIMKARREAGATKVDILDSDGSNVTAKLESASWPADQLRRRSMFLNLRADPVASQLASETPVTHSDVKKEGRVRVFKKRQPDT